MGKSVLNDAFFKSFDSSVLDISRADTLPPECYNDPEFFEFEKDAIFYRDWLCVGRVGWLKEPGDYFTTTNVNEPIVVLKNQAGEIKAFSPVCRHRAGDGEDLRLGSEANPPARIQGRDLARLHFRELRHERRAACAAPEGLDRRSDQLRHRKRRGAAGG
jgi:hypothetical protein